MPKITQKKIKLVNSLRLLKRAKRVIPCATQTLSKGYTQWSVGASPLFLDSGKGCEVQDVDGNTYIDYGMALGPFILGYGDKDVNTAVEKQLRKGTIFTLPHPLEIEAAEHIIQSVPGAEMVRFGKNGSDVTSAAVKLARAYTGKEKIISCGYHGWQDWYIASTERNAGIPKVMHSLIKPMQYNNLDSLKKILKENKGEIAGLIIEPVYTIPPEKGFLDAVREITKKEGIVLIFDELFSGFRWGMGGAGEYFGVMPDLACFGKAMANGFPISAIAGKRDLMMHFEKVFFSFTYGGDALSLAATVATIQKLKKKLVHKYIWNIGTVLKTGIEELLLKHEIGSIVSIIGYPVKTVFSFSDTSSVSGLEMKTFFQQECAKRGVLFIGYHLPSYAHKRKHIGYTLRVYDEVMGLFKEAIRSNTLRKLLVGEVVTQVFKNVGDRSVGASAISLKR